MDYNAYAQVVAEDLVRLKRRIVSSRIPAKIVDQNLIIGTWNIRAFGDVFKSWDENPSTPKRNLRALVYIAEVIRKFDVIAIQEVKRDTAGVRMLLEELLGPNWGLIISDVTGGATGNSERLSFIYDRRRVQPSGLAGEIVLPPTANGNPSQQFDRTPYIVGFKTALEKFSLLTAHIRYGDGPADRIGEINSLAKYIATEIRQRSTSAGEEKNVIVLGDFNIEERGDNPLFKAFVSSGLMVPSQLLNLKSTYDSKPKFYDQIAWFMNDLNLPFSGNAGVIDFASAVYKDLSLSQMSYRLSDHFPLWTEFLLDRSSENMAKVLGLDPGQPDPFSSIRD